MQTQIKTTVAADAAFFPRINQARGASRAVPPARLGVLPVLVGDEVHQPSAWETMDMTLLAIHDSVREDSLESAERAAEDLVHQLRLLRLKRAASEAGVVSHPGQ
jgi:hypothetical protein